MSARQAITLVAWREIHERLRSRVFVWSTVLLLLLVGGSTAMGGALSRTQTYDVAVVAPAPPGLDAALRRAAKPFDAKVRLTTMPSAAAARERLRSKKADAVLLLAADRIAFRAGIDAKLAAIADTAVRTVRRHLPPAPELTATTLEPSKGKSTDAEVLVAMLGASMLLAAIAVYGQWVLTGVVEEKANRVVEVILSTVRPRHLMAGKVVGIGLLGLMQIALIGGLAAVLLVAGVFDAPASLGGSVALLVPWFALGFALYAVAYAAAGAVASRTQDASSAGLPVTYTLLAMFFLGYVVLSVDDGGTLAQILTVFPLTAPLVLPARSAPCRCADLAARARARARPGDHLRTRPPRRPHLQRGAPPLGATARALGSAAPRAPALVRHTPRPETPTHRKGTSRRDLEQPGGWDTRRWFSRMELNRALSNLEQHLMFLVSGGGGRGSTIRPPLLLASRCRSNSGPARVRIVARVLADAGRPMRVCEVHCAAELAVGLPLKRSSVKAALTAGAARGTPMFDRVCVGVYRSVLTSIGDVAGEPRPLGEAIHSRVSGCQTAPR